MALLQQPSESLAVVAAAPDLSKLSTAELVALAIVRCPDYLSDGTDAYDLKYPTWQSM